MQKTKQALNILGFIGVVTMNTLAIALPLFGRSTGEISDLFPSLFTPSGITFSIWSLIYLLLAIFVVRQAKGLFQKNGDAPEVVSVIGWLFVANCLCNMAWIVVWHSLLVELALVIMLGLLVTLILIYRRLSARGQMHWADLLPFSIYLGWITVATIANVSIVLINNGWDGFGIAPGVWTAIMIGAGTLIGLAVLWRQRDTWFTLVLIWAFYGIFSARSAESPVVETVTTAAMAGLMVLLLASVAVGLLKFRRR